MDRGISQLEVRHTVKATTQALASLKSVGDVQTLRMPR